MQPPPVAHEAPCVPAPAAIARTKIPPTVVKRSSIASTRSGSTTPDKQLCMPLDGQYCHNDRSHATSGRSRQLLVSPKFDASAKDDHAGVAAPRLYPSFIRSSDFEAHLSYNFATQLWFARSSFATQVAYRAFRMLRSCQYPPEDILQCAALTVCHWPRIRQKIAHIVSRSAGTVDLKESVYIGILQLFLSHCWLLDQTCPLKEWHRHIFGSYCSFGCLNDAMMKLFALQEFKLSFDPGVVQSVVAQLAVPRRSDRFNA